jgi:hypothetical protein
MVEYTSEKSALFEEMINKTVDLIEIYKMLEDIPEDEPLDGDATEHLAEIVLGISDSHQANWNYNEIDEFMDKVRGWGYIGKDESPLP